MNRSQGEFEVSEIVGTICTQVGLAFPPQELSAVGRGTVPIVLGKAISLDGRKTSRSALIYLSQKFLAELLSSPNHQDSLRDYLQGFSRRLENPDEDGFLTLKGIPLAMKLDWPLQRSPDGRDGVFVRVGTNIPPRNHKEANFGLFMSGTLEAIVFPSLVPVFTESVMINAVRKAIDSRQIAFYEAGMHPLTLQAVALMSADYDDRTERFPFFRASDSEINSFIRRKVYWLAFRAGNPRRQVLIPRPLRSPALLRSQPPLQLFTLSLVPLPRTLLQSPRITVPLRDFIRDCLLDKGMSTKTIISPVRELIDPIPVGEHMTIAIGMHSYNNGVVLCADQQLTSGDVAKMYESKILSLDGQQWCISIAHAGGAETAKLVQTSIFTELCQRMGGDAEAEIVEMKQILTHVLAETRKSYPRELGKIQLLFGVGIHGVSHLFKSTGALLRPLYPSEPMEIIGWGDSSLTRFFQNILFKRAEGIDTHAAICMCSYMVNRAKEFIPYCGGRTDVVVIQDGEFLDVSTFIPGIERDALEIERKFAEEIRAMSGKYNWDAVKRRASEKSEREQ